MKELNGRELADYIKERQTKDVHRLKQALKIFPKLAIVNNLSNPASDLYMRMKQSYGDDIGVEVAVCKTTPQETISEIKRLNRDKSIHGIIVQLPVAAEAEIDEVLNAVVGKKDVDGLGERAGFTPATPLAIIWLLEGYNIDFSTRKTLLVGKGRLVGAPLARILSERGLEFVVADSKTKCLAETVKKNNLIITATGKPGLISSSMLAPKTVVVDAGVAEIDGHIKGDLADDVYLREDLILTPRKGGVGPLTVTALFENTLKASLGT